MYTDLCEITNITRDAQFGKGTSGTPFTIKCRVENNDVSKEGSSGTRKHHKRLYFLPPGTVVKNGDQIRTTKQRGVTITEDPIEIDEAFPIGARIPHHVEVYIY